MPHKPKGRLDQGFQKTHLSANEVCCRADKIDSNSNKAQAVQCSRQSALVVFTHA